MKPTSLLAALVVVATITLPVSPAAARSTTSSPGKIARAGFAMARTLYRVGRVKLETVYAWAHRLRRAEGRGKLKAHVARVVALLALVQKRVASGQASKLDDLLARYEVFAARAGKLRW